MNLLWFYSSFAYAYYDALWLTCKKAAGRCLLFAFLLVAYCAADAQVRGGAMVCGGGRVAVWPA